MPSACLYLTHKINVLHLVDLKYIKHSALLTIRVLLNKMHPQSKMQSAQLAPNSSIHFNLTVPLESLKNEPQLSATVS